VTGDHSPCTVKFPDISLTFHGTLLHVAVTHVMHTNSIITKFKFNSNKNINSVEYHLLLITIDVSATAAAFLGMISLHRLALFFSDTYRFFDPPVYFVAFSVDHLSLIPIYDMVESDGLVCDF